MNSTTQTRNRQNMAQQPIAQCKYCGGFNHTINDCQDPEISKLCCAYMTYQYKTTTEFDNFVRRLSYQKFFVIAYFCLGYNEREIHPTTKKNILNRILELHELTKNAQRINSMTSRYVESQPVIINARKDRINLQHTIEGYQIDVMQRMDENTIRDTLYMLSRGHDLELQFSQANDVLLRENAVEGLVALRELAASQPPPQPQNEMTVEQILQTKGITWTNTDTRHEMIECPICYMNIQTNICQYNCSHTFCYSCVCRTLRTGNAVCSLCRANLQNIVNYQGNLHK